MLERIVLNIGSGPRSIDRLHARFREPGWREIRVDIDPTAEPDVLATTTDLPMFGAGSVDAIWSSHNIEHLFAHEVPVALAEYHRVLRPGGVVMIVTPDLQLIGQYLAEDRFDEPIYEAPAGPIAAHDIVYGHRASIAAGHVAMAHRTGFTARSLERALLTAGFTRVHIERGNLELGAYAERDGTAPPSITGAA
jgi:predicted SAM-dependent methyltransferase